MNGCFHTLMLRVKNVAEDVTKQFLKIKRIESSQVLSARRHLPLNIFHT